MIVKHEDKIRLYCKGAGNFVYVCMYKSFRILALDSVVFARLDEESNEEKLTTLDHLGVCDVTVLPVHLHLLPITGLCQRGIEDIGDSLQGVDTGAIFSMGSKIPRSQVRYTPCS